MTAETTTEATDDAQETQEAAQGAPEGAEAAEADLETPEPAQDDDSEHPAAEAKRYRLRLRETETERDQLAGRLETMQKAEAERIAAATVTQPASIWAAGTTIADVLDEAGNVDPEKVKAATTAAAESLGLALAKPPGYAPYAGRVPQNRPRGGMAEVIRGE